METTFKYDIIGFSDDLGLPLEDIANLYSEFLKEIKSEVCKLKILFNEKDWNSIKIILHNIKGISANYRIIDVYEETAKIHNAIKICDYDNIEPLFNGLLIIFENAIKEISKYFEQKGFPV